MKKLLTIIFVLGFVAIAYAVTLTIDIPANDVPRVQAAFGSILGLGRPATQTEVSNAVRDWIIGTTKDYEKRQNIAQFTPPPLQMQPTPTPTATP